MRWLKKMEKMNQNNSDGDVSIQEEESDEEIVNGVVVMKRSAMIKQKKKAKKLKIELMEAKQKAIEIDIWIKEQAQKKANDAEELDFKTKLTSLMKSKSRDLKDKIKEV